MTPDAGPDKVELAFRRMDRNKDGYITWEEFNKVIKRHEIIFCNSIVSRILGTCLQARLRGYSRAVTRYAVGQDSL